MSALHPPSEEQQRIVDAMESNNVIVDSVAGSGKTTTILHVARKYPCRILVLTYNARLRHETMDRANALELPMTVHTYHSFAYHHIGSECKDDSGIIKFLNGDHGVVDAASMIDWPEYDIIIIDEAQDMTDIYHKLACKIIARSPQPRLMIIGDQYQSIYGFAGADPRFITMADQLYDSKWPWVRLDLSISYRITRPMAALVNDVLGTERLQAVKDGDLPSYTIYNSFKVMPIINEVRRLLSTGLSNSDIFILSPTVRPKPARRNAKGWACDNPIRTLANALSRPAEGLLVYIPTSDADRLDPEIMQNKIVFSSFHQSKGLERRHVILIGFDETYAKYYNKDDPGDNERCSNAMYVALTRATTSLSIYHGHTKRPLQYVNMERVAGLCDVSYIHPLKCKPISAPQETHLSVTDMCRQLASKLLMRCMECITIVPLRKDTVIDIERKARQRTKLTRPDYNTLDYHEEVSTITGTALTMYCEFVYNNHMTIHKLDDHKALQTIRAEFPHRMGKALIPNPPRACDVLWLANHSMAAYGGLYVKLRQVKSYKWLSDEKLGALTARVRAEILSNDVVFEEPVSLRYDGCEISGLMDILAGDRVYEIKTVDELTPEHHIQLAVYMYMMITSKKAERLGITRYLLYNVKADELVELVPDISKLETLMRLLICSKTHNKGIVPDDEFTHQLAQETLSGHTCKRCKELGWAD